VNKYRLRPWRFLAITFAISWSCWIPIALAGVDGATSPWAAVRILGGLGPFLAAMIMVLRSEPGGRADFFQRATRFSWRRVSWYAGALLLFPAMNAIATLIGMALGGEPATFDQAVQLWASPTSIPGYLMFALLFGPVPEELGWRGYSLDGFVDRYGVMGASAILGVAHALWYLPLFYIAGTWQYEVVGSAFPGIWWYMVPTAAASLLYTWIYRRTDRSTLSAILLHLSINLSGELFGLTQYGRLMQTIVVVIIVYGFVVVMGPEGMSRHAAGDEAESTAP